jgi:alkaline phosphatase
MPKLSWRSTNHTNALVPFHVKGAGSEQFMNVADEMDPMRGRYLDNTDVAKTISQLLREQPASP